MCCTSSTTPSRPSWSSRSATEAVCTGSAKPISWLHPRAIAIGGASAPFVEAPVSACSSRARTRAGTHSQSRPRERRRLEAGSASLLTSWHASNPLAHDVFECPVSLDRRISRSEGASHARPEAPYCPSEFEVGANGISTPEITLRSKRREDLEISAKRRSPYLSTDDRRHEVACSLQVEREGRQCFEARLEDHRFQVARPSFSDPAQTGHDIQLELAGPRYAGSEEPGHAEHADAVHCPVATNGRGAEDSLDIGFVGFIACPRCLSFQTQARCDPLARIPTKPDRLRPIEFAPERAAALLDSSLTSESDSDTATQSQRAVRLRLRSVRPEGNTNDNQRSADSPRSLP